jgi:hypothetical protein
MNSVSCSPPPLTTRSIARATSSTWTGFRANEAAFGSRRRFRAGEAEERQELPIPGAVDRARTQIVQRSPAAR